MRKNTPYTRRSLWTLLRPSLLLVLFILVAGFVAIPIFRGFPNSTAARSNKNKQRSQSGTVLEKTQALPALFNYVSPFLQSPLSVVTYAGDCMTPKSVFNLQDTDLTVCAKVTGGQAGQVIIWSNANFVAVQNSPLGSGESTFTLSSGSSLGEWRVILYEPFGGSVYAVTPFTVIDAANPSADLSLVKGGVSETISDGAQALFTVKVTNLGPSDATSVQLTDSIPANTTFSSFALISGPSSTNCVLPSAGANSGDVVCTIPLLSRGEEATFVAAYDVPSGLAAGTVILNSASVVSEVPDPSSDNNSSTGQVRIAGVTSETCTLDCPANVVVTANTTSGGEFGAFVNYAAATVNGNCGAVTNNPASGSFFTVGTHSIVSTSELGGSSCTFTVTVLDTAPPTIMCPGNITATAPSGATEHTLPVPPGTGTPVINASGGGTVVGIRSDDTPATFDDDGNVITPAVIHALTDPYPIGTTGILWTVTDAGGRTASCSQSITILEAGARDPVTITCPANVTVEAPAGSCQATVSSATIGSPSTNPSDSNVVVEAQRSDGLSLSDPFPAGTTLITWRATDQINGSTASCVQNVTVTVANSGDTTAPTLTVPPNVNVTTSSCSVTLDDELGVAQATDTGACNGSVTVTRTGVPANFVFPTGTTTIIYTATDAAGNTSTGLQLVTVTESPAIPPTITAPNDVTANTGPGATSCGTFVSDATLGTAIASDNCQGVSVTRTGVPAGNIFPVGTTTVTYTATDASGNTASDTQTVTVIDNTPPVISCPSNITLEPTCPTGAIATYTAPVGTDNCPNPITTRTAGLASGSVFPVGTTTVTYSVTDASGNSASCSFTVTVLTPQAVIQNMINTINGLPLSGSQKQGLISKLTAALDAINQGKTNVACNKLGDFINQVTSFINNGTLTAAQGQSLINSANHVRNYIGCTNLPCS